MPKLCVEIEFDTETGQYSVEKCEPQAEMDEGEMSEMGGMHEMGNGQMMQNREMMGKQEPASEEQTFQSVDQALQAAKAILSQTPDQQEMSAMRGDVAGEVWPQKQQMPIKKGMM